MSKARGVALSYAKVFWALWNETEVSNRLREAEKLQREFTNLAAHELRTPITPIVITMHLAKRIKGAEDGEEDRWILSHDQVRIIERNVAKLEKLASQLLEVSRIEAKGVELSFETGNLNLWINEEMENAASRMLPCQKGSLNFESSLGAETVFVRADKSKVQQVISSLIANSIRFLPQDRHGEIKITTSVWKEGNKNFALVNVRDNGQGIDNNVLPRLFQKFAASDTLGATGLGLYISKCIVEAHGGRIWAQNNTDSSGATITFTLPLKAMH
jgi:signal transduction histidine kinase